MSVKPFSRRSSPSYTQHVAGPIDPQTTAVLLLGWVVALITTLT
jgi:hypothetical protein